ncbi:hypothetical protein GCM10027280_19800 [Micromonospora polyrhachis]|uniref:ABC-type multidrug transport system ATPase subunit n=1 Tax=Micromonospora polyrhachis TaxID=1282883 RepID=A0A7W7SLM6_9ACTN|nr:hypothetical protein [Micromonospora polyrhachis]MBB4957074.1 ABC-type multidrug transport system ATPase subunit [Micromonospora polyrhachis]
MNRTRLLTRDFVVSRTQTVRAVPGHYLDEADSMAERVVVVDHGEVIADDIVDALKTKLAGDRIVVAAATAVVGLGVRVRTMARSAD